MSAPTPLAKRLQLCLEASGLKQADLARACKVKPSSVSEWLNGSSKSMRGVSVLRAAELFSVNALWLATGEGPQRPALQPATPNTAAMARSTDADSAWPFQYITPARWFALPIADRQRVETFVDATAQARESTQPTRGTGTTG